MLRPKSIAIVGASDREGWANWSKVIYENLRATGVGLPIYPVNPRYAAMWGARCYPAIDKLPQPADLALVIVPAPHVPEILRAGSASGVKAAIVYSAGFDQRLESELDVLCADGLRLCGPNCMGTLSIQERLLFYPSNPVTRVRALPPGDVGVVFQSGGTVQFWLQQAAVRGLGFTYVVTSGSEIDLDLADYLNFLIEDERTRLVCCMVEGIRRPAAFVAAARKALAAGKPILLVKIGRSTQAQAAAQSHTGLLAGDDAVFDAVCERYGIVRCASLDDLTETALALQFGRVPKGRGVAMVTYSGGAKGLFLDDAQAARLELARLGSETLAALAPHMDEGVVVENPLDAGASIPYDQPRFAAVCAAIAGDPGVDVLAIQGQLPTLVDDRQKPDAFRALAAATEKPIVAYSRTAHNVGDAAREFQRAAGLPFLQGIPQTARVLGSLVRYGVRRAAVPRDEAPADVGDDGAADFAEALAAYGIPSPGYRYVATPEDAVQAAREIGFPIALKAVAPQIVHKTELDAVRLGLGDDVAVQRAAIELANNLRTKGIGPIGLLVQEMVGGLEMIAGARDDDQFGPFVVLGAGGVLVEALHDVALRLLPVEKDDVLAMLGELRCAALLGDFRGRRARDVEALAEAVVGLSRFYLERRRWVRDVEINPLTVLERGYGVRAVDIRVIRKVV